MQKTFYFYDLETSGLNPRGDRLMQFAGQRTDENFQPVGEPANILVELANDTLPGPYAIMVTGITPQETKRNGISEREFCRFLAEEVATPGTTILGYNSIRFDDEFIRATLWRNFHDAYAWQWKDGRSRWDLLDVVRMTRALRPEGITWPTTPEGKPTNRLELLTKENGIVHAHAHDALSDVEALIAVTKLIQEKQPQLFAFMLDMRDKRRVAQMVNLKNPAPFVYASGRYGTEHNFITVAYPLAPAPNGNLLVFDLRYNLDELLKEERESFFPMVKKLQYNHCPAVAPLSVLEKENGWGKVELTPEQIQQNLASLQAHPEFAAKMQADAEMRAQKMQQAQTELADDESLQAQAGLKDPESALYDGFLNDHDALLCAAVRNNDARDLADFHPDFADERLPELLLHYKAKNFPETLAAGEMEKWEKYRAARLNAQAPKFLQEMQEIQAKLAAGETLGGKSAEECEYLLEELRLWYESLGD